MEEYWDSRSRCEYIVSIMTDSNPSYTAATNNLGYDIDHNHIPHLTAWLIPIASDFVYQYHALVQSLLASF